MYLIYLITVFLWNFIMVSSGPLQEYAKCELETNVTTIEILRFATFELPETDEGKCYITCIMKVAGIINGTGSFDTNKTLEVVKNYVTDETKLLQLESVLTECGYFVNGKEESSVCDTSISIINCISSRIAESPRIRRTITIPLNVTLPPLTIVLAQLSIL
ncbi:hypothetical protein O3M35_000850 [Rhynocoris fuscipes]|uniref:Uncharacterized protein n=1 Tax=Rhynocoris fuscipes TaxID=488301 RepID=A0AAW1DN64_9HEMI